MQVPPDDDHPPRKLLKLSDFTSEDELNDLSVKQLKELLTLNRVDYKGCVEKSELLERVIMLWIDNNQHRNSGKCYYKQLCLIITKNSRTKYVKVRLTYYYNGNTFFFNHSIGKWDEPT